MGVALKNCCEHPAESLWWDPQRIIFVCKECGAQTQDTELAEALGVSVSETSFTVSDIRSITTKLKAASAVPSNGNFTIYPQPGSLLFGKTQEEAEEIIDQVLGIEPREISK